MFSLFEFKWTQFAAAQTKKTNESPLQFQTVQDLILYHGNQKRLGNSHQHVQSSQDNHGRCQLGGPPNDKDWDAWIDHESAKLQTEDETYESIVQNTPHNVTAAHESFCKLLEGDEIEWFNYFPMLGVRTEYNYRYSRRRR